MEAYFSSLFEDIPYEWSLIPLLNLTDSSFLKQSKITDDIKNLALEKLKRQRILKEDVAVSLGEQHFLFN